jgi:phosphoribosylglycinamide formyltransferase-1
MSNSHPGPIPETADTFGAHTSQRVIDLGLLASKHTAHLVASGVDTGPVIKETEVPYWPGDADTSLFSRVQATEKRELPIALNQFLKGQQEYLSGEI